MKFLLTTQLVVCKTWFYLLLLEGVCPMTVKEVINNGESFKADLSTPQAAKIAAFRSQSTGSEAFELRALVWKGKNKEGVAETWCGQIEVTGSEEGQLSARRSDQPGSGQWLVGDKIQIVAICPKIHSNV